MAGGGSLVLLPPVLLGGQLLCAAGDTVVAFDTTTGEELYELRSPGPVSSLCAASSTSLYVGCTGGQLLLHDITSGEQLERWELAESGLESAVVAGGTAYASCQWGQQQAGRLFAYDLAARAAAGGRGKTSAACHLVASPGGQLLAAVDCHTAMVWCMDRFPHSPLVLTHTKALTCAALSHSGDVLAVGDVTGRIMLWRGVHQAALAADSGAEPHLPQTTVHWHAEPVRCLEFSSDGTYLLSGGHEGVLVVWELASGRRAYLPRLGSCLQHIATCATDPSRVAVSLAENVVRVVDLAAMSVLCSVRGICLSPAAAAASIAVQPASGRLVLPGAAASLQFFDPLKNVHTDRLQLSDLSLSHATRTSLAAAKLPPPTHSLFNASGELLVTLEQHAGVSGGVAALLKAWRRSQLQSYGRSYTLSPGEGNPCSMLGALSAVAVHPTLPLVAVAHASGGVSCWEQGPGRGGNAGPWALAPIAAMQGVQATSLAFSPDGSVLAVGGTTHSPVLLVDAETGRVLAALPPLLDGGGTQPAAPLRCLAFLADGLHLAAQWDGGAAVYDLVAGSVRWATQVPVAAMAVDAGAAQLALATPSGAVVQLGASGQAGAAAGLLSQRVLSAHFIPASQGQLSMLIVLNDAQQYAATQTAAAVVRRGGESGRKTRAAAASAGSAKEVAAGATAPGTPPSRVRQGGSVAASFQRSASHLLAAASELCPLALESLLLD